MKCPACKMETPEEPGYCDFCKEPFRRKPAEPEAKPVVAVPPEVLVKLAAVKAPPAAPPEPAGTIPPEFAALDAGERIPEVPPAARRLAWGFLAAVLFLSALGLFYVMARPRRLRGPVPVGPTARPPGAAHDEPGTPPPPPPLLPPGP